MADPLLQRIARGDEAAVAACLDEYGGTIWSLAERYLKGFGEDLEDAVQEVFVEVWRCAGRYDPARGSEPAFIATIAHRRLIDRQRRAQARRTSHIDDERILESKPQMVRSPDDSDEVRNAAVAFEKLAIEEQQVLWYALYHGLSHERIANAINIPLGTVKTRIRRGINRLREALGGGAASGTAFQRGKGAAS